MLRGLVIGSTLGEKYAVVRQLGEGGMGAVYEARHTGTGRRVAVKLITGELSHDPDLVARFELEARALGAIESEHIAQVLDVGRDPVSGAPYLVMEYLVGEDLEHLFSRAGRLPAELALRLGVQACLGLAKAHAQGIVHRDIKPANLFLTERDDGELRLKILDFGIAKVTAPEATPAPQKKALTRIGTFLGSPLYMSPEQTRGSAGVDHRTDLWSLGIVLYQAIAGRTPFEDAPSVAEFVALVNTIPVTPLRAVAPDVDPAVAAAIERALVIDPAQRYQSAAEMRAALEAFLPQGTSIRRTMIGATGPAMSPSFAPTTPHPTPIAAAPTAHVGTPPPGATQPATPVLPATVLAQPVGVTPAPPMVQVPGGGLIPLGAAPPNVPAPPPATRPRGSNVGVFVAVAVLALAGGGLAAALGFGWLGGKHKPEPAASASASASAPHPADPAAAATALQALVGTWWGDAGVVYDAVQNGESVELRIRDPEALANQGYVAGDTHFALRPIPGEQGAYRVAARIRPLPPKGTTYDRTRARTTCENTWRQIDKKQLRAELHGDHLRIQSVRAEPASSVFVREGNRVVGCNGLAEAPVVESEILLSNTAPTSVATPHYAPIDAGAKHDAGAPQDAGAPLQDAGTPIQDAGTPVHDAGTPAHDAGAPVQDAGAMPGGIGAACRNGLDCFSNNCVAHRCEGNTPGSRCTRPSNCASHRCIANVCQ
jgi:serine/threonine-protein kinase